MSFIVLREAKYCRRHIAESGYYPRFTELPFDMVHVVFRGNTTADLGVDRHLALTSSGRLII